MDHTTLRKASYTEAMALSSPLDRLPMQRSPDKIKGCIVGGAAGDALGYAVEFLSEPRIFQRFGPSGITCYQLTEGLARFSDDTQMTLFTANGLLFANTRGHMRGILAPYPGYVATAYQEWYQTQTRSFSPDRHKFLSCWLMNVPELYARRAPGNTCMSAIMRGCRGTIEDPINDSKGCGGVMRVAPLGLFFGASGIPPAQIDLMAADIAALTHGHEMGYIPAALLAHIVRLLACGRDITPREAVLDGLTAMKALFPHAGHLPQFCQLIEKAVVLSAQNGSDLEAIHALGAGWCGDEALAIAIYCALKYPQDFDKALIAAVNHEGDSDSTGAITGNILGAYLGLSGIPEKYTKDLELMDVLLEIGEDLSLDCPIDEYEPIDTPQKKNWLHKYVTITYAPKRAFD